MTTCSSPSSSTTCGCHKLAPPSGSGPVSSYFTIARLCLLVHETSAAQLECSSQAFSTHTVPASTPYTLEAVQHIFKVKVLYLSYIQLIFSCHCSSKARSILLCPNVFRAIRISIWTTDFSSLAIA